MFGDAIQALQSQNRTAVWYTALDYRFCLGNDRLYDADHKLCAINPLRFQVSYDKRTSHSTLRHIVIFDGKKLSGLDW
jgi:hypothetical protein